MGSKIAKWAIIIVVAGGLGIWRSSSNWESDSTDVLKEAMSIVQEWECYGDNKGIIDQCAERAHKASFAKAYKPGSRRRASDIDVPKYLKGFFAALSQEFDLQNRHDLKKCLSDAQGRMNEAASESNEGSAAKP